MPGKNVFKVARGAVFFALLVFLFIRVAGVFQNKSGFTSTISTFLRLPPDSLDVLVLGSSHVYCAVIPVELYREFGLRSFVFATREQPAALTWFFLEIALRRHRPKVVLVETYMFLRDDGHVKVNEGVAHDSLDAIPLCRKVGIIFSFDHEGEPEDYIFPFCKYHARWKELNYNDFTMRPSEVDDVLKGYKMYVAKRKKNLKAVDLSRYEAWPLHDEYIYWLERINSSVKRFGGKLVLVTAPFRASEGFYARERALNEWCHETGIDMIDMNVEYASTRIDMDTDFYDGGHLNLFGAGKATEYIGKYLMKHYFQNSPKIDASEKITWGKAIAEYDKKREHAIKTDSKNPASSASGGVKNDGHQR